MINASEELAKVPQFTKIRSVICAMIVNIMIGSYYFFSNINAYVAAYLRQYNPEVTSKDTLLIMPIWIVCQSAGTIISIKLCAKYGFPKVSNVSYSIFALANLFMVIVKSYWLFVITYGGITGLMIGTGYMPALTIAWTYYPDKKPIVTGVSLFTAGISAAILSPISTSIVNPDNVKDYENDPAVYNRVPFLFFCLFLYFGGLIAIGALMQPPPFEPKTLKELKELEEIEKANRDELAKEEREMEVIKADGADSDKKASGLFEHVNPKQSEAKPLLEEEEFQDAVNEEIRKDANGAISQQMSTAMNLPTAQKVALVADRPNIRALINERKESLRQSIRMSINMRGIRNSVMRLKGFQGLNTKEIEEKEKHVMELINRPPESTPEERQLRMSLRKSIAKVHLDCPSLSFALRSWAFISLAIMAYSCSIYNYFMNSVWKQFYVTKIEVTDQQMALILSYGAFANSIVRVLSGIIMMKYDFKYIYLTLVCSTVFCCFTIDSFLVNYMVGAIYSMTVFGGIGVQVTIFPTVCTKVFGPVIGPKVFPFVFSFFSMANLTQYFILKFTSDWTFMFWLFGVIACVGVALGFIFTSSPDWKEAQYLHQSRILKEEDQNDKPLLNK